MLNWAKWESYKNDNDDSYKHYFTFLQDDINQYVTPITYTDEYGTHTDNVITTCPPNNYGSFEIEIVTNSLSIAGTYVIDGNKDYEIWSEIASNWKLVYDKYYKAEIWSPYSLYDSDATSGTLTIKQEGKNYTFSFKGKGWYGELHNFAEDNVDYTNEKENINIEMNYTGEFDMEEHDSDSSYSTPVKSAKRENGNRVIKFRKVEE